MRAARSFDFNAYLQLCRPLNAVMAALGMTIGYLLAFQPTQMGIMRVGEWAFPLIQPFSEIFNLNFFLTLFSIIFIISGGQAINDYFDRDVDAKQKKTRPIPSGKVSPENALLFSMILFAAGNILALLVQSPTQLTFPIAIFFSFLFVIYSAFMQRLKFAGNVVVALGVGFTYLFGASAVQLTPLVLAVSLAPFFANWAREIIKDVEDKEMDRGNKLSLPLITGQKNVEIITAVVLLAGVVAGYLPAIFFNAGTAYFVIVTLANTRFFRAWMQLQLNHPGEAASAMKHGMLIALVAQLTLLLG
ncbi:MAG: geranylgeranylglycerol-phosphate geranylgeranyltransferase [Candidatus Iainarchaeum archaeon]|uniref:Geranylgeranylglycerol-phosphate geranylgeranyltransferase n=1 Tax=Candidatus Iainarchaeum sp. TaxID=3101447 RepID=A0A7T9DJ12_9ARCH|nr:MAG: geranylgeranylglycerol-phosphate geranylgeranyltransferase [Candidatus Diapherotrites archaeon]